MSSRPWKIIRIILFSLLFLLLVAATALFILYKNFKKPDMISSSNMITFDENGKMLANTTVIIKNNNSYEIRIDSLAYTMSIKGATYLRGHKEKPIVLKAHSLDTFVLPYVMEYKKMDKDFANQDSAESKFNIDGYLTALWFKKVHLSIPLKKELTFFKAPEIIGNQDNLSIDSNGKVSIDIALKLVNKNKYPVQADSSYYSIYVEHQLYFKGKRMRPLHIEALDTQKVTLPLVFDLKKFLANFSHRDSAVFRFVFDLLLTTHDFKKEHFIIPIQRKLVVIQPIVPSVGKVEIPSINFKSARLIIPVDIKNPNPITFKVKKVSYRLQVEDHQWAMGDIPDKIILTKKSSSHIDIPVTLTFKQIKKNLKEYLKGDKKQHYKLKANFTLLTGDAKIPEIKMFVQDTGTLHLGQLLKKKK